MTKTMRATVLAAVAALTLAGCQGGNTKQIGGAAIGGIAGGLLGSQIGQGKGQLAMTAAGTLLGAFLGSEAGRSLDQADQMAMQRQTVSALEYAPSGQSSQWRNPDSGNYGTITPYAPTQLADGTYCREFEQTIWVDNRSETATGRACRQPDGSWRIVQ